MSRISLNSNPSGTGTLSISSPNTNSDRSIVLPDASGTVQVSGSPISGTTGTFTGLVDISAAGAGQIQFPATQNASANANTLDDYEEGTFTPVLGTDGSHSITMTSQSGRYTKIGSVVHFQFHVSWSSFTGGGNIQVNSLPFAFRYRAGNLNREQGFPVIYASGSVQNFAFGQDQSNLVVASAYLYNFNRTGFAGIGSVGSSGYIAVHGTGFVD